MRKMKKLVSAVLTLAMALAMCAGALAADETYSITIENGTEGHTYLAYQIFAGELSTNAQGEKVLANIVWGSGVNAAGQTALLSFGKGEGAADFEDAAALAASLTTAETAERFAKEAARYLDAEHSSHYADGKYTISGLSAGYYLVKDADDSLTGDDFYTAYILKVVSDTTAAPKGDKPSLDKQVKHNELGTWGVVSDHQIGDLVSYQLIAAIPDTTGYETYSYSVGDTMSAGLTCNVSGSSDVDIRINSADGARLQEGYTVTKTDNGFTVSFDVLKLVADGTVSKGDKLYIGYNATLNENAKIYSDGCESNAAYLEYSNNPNDPSDMGRTLTKKTYTWTFQMDVTKVDGEGNNLTGAKFVLSTESDLTAAGLNCDENGVPAVTENLIGFIDNGNGTYTVAPAGTESVTYVLEAGTAVIKGLDDSVNYYLYETKAPVGYNLKKEPVKFSISSGDYTEDGSALAGTPSVAVDGGAASTTLELNVVNQAGAVLPETGGIGTTIFYVVGALLVIGAGVVLVTRKRMEKQDR